MPRPAADSGLSSWTGRPQIAVPARQLGGQSWPWCEMYGADAALTSLARRLALEPHAPPGPHPLLRQPECESCRCSAASASWHSAAHQFRKRTNRSSVGLIGTVRRVTMRGKPSRGRRLNIAWRPSGLVTFAPCVFPVWTISECQSSAVVVGLGRFCVNTPGTMFPMFPDGGQAVSELSKERPALRRNSRCARTAVVRSMRASGRSVWTYPVDILRISYGSAANVRLTHSSCPGDLPRSSLTPTHWRQRRSTWPTIPP